MTNKEMTNDEARAYFVDSNERIISVAKDENRYNYETQQIENVFMRRDFEAKELAIKALEQTDVLEKIRAEIEEYKSRQLTLAIGVDDLEKGKQIALEYVLAILDKYKAASEKGMSDNFEAQPTDVVKCDCTTEEIAKSFTEDVEAVKDQLDGQPTNITVEMHPKEAIEILEYERDNNAYIWTEPREKIHQALTMGVKALKAQIKADECFNNIDLPMIRVNLESVCKDCYYNDGEVHGQCIICDKYRVILQDDKRIEGDGE